MEPTRAHTGRLSKYVFVDSQVHFKQHHNYRQGQLYQLQVSCIDHDVRTIATDITLGEISDHITENSMKVMDDLTSGIRYCQWIADDIKTISADLKTLEANFEKRHKQDFELFLKKTGCHLHPTGEKTMKEVLLAYFRGESPFKTKKHRPDLPDAIAFFTLKEFCSINNEHIAVITDDARLLEAFKKSDEHFIAFRSIPEYLAHVAEIEDRDILLHRQIIAENSDYIFDVVGSALEDLDISFEHHDYELRKYGIEEMDLVSCEVANTYPDGFSASFRVEARIYAEVSWYESGYSEDDPGGTTYGHVDETCTIEGFIRVHLGPEPGPEIFIEVDSIDSTVFLYNEAEEDRDEDYDR